MEQARRRKTAFRWIDKVRISRSALGTSRSSAMRAFAAGERPRPSLGALTIAAVVSPASRSQEMQRGDLETWRMVQTRSGTRSGSYLLRRSRCCAGQVRDGAPRPGGRRAGHRDCGGVRVLPAVAFPLGLGVLTGKGVTAWRRALANLTRAATTGTASVQQADSRGQVTLVSSDPGTQVKIDYYYYYYYSVHRQRSAADAGGHPHRRAGPADARDEAVVQTVRRDQSEDPR